MNNCNRIYRLSFNAFTLKVIAVSAMLIDHIGAALYPDIVILRAIGRLTLPIMAFFIAEGYEKTSNIKKYILRLAIFAGISIFPYRLIFHNYFNIMFDLLIGLFVIYITDKLNNDTYKWALVLLISLMPVLVHSSGMYGTIMYIFLFHRYRNEFDKLLISTVILNVFMLLVYIFYYLIQGYFGVLISPFTYIRMLAILALLFIFKYNGEKGLNAKYMFYWFYPGHLMLIYLIKGIIFK